MFHTTLPRHAQNMNRTQRCIYSTQYSSQITCISIRECNKGRNFKVYHSKKVDTTWNLRENKDLRQGKGNTHVLMEKVARVWIMSIKGKRKI